MTAAERFNPFPGLRPFGPDEDYLFFGRERQTDDLLRRLRRHRFVAVIGASGSGKSSLVRAGLLPALHGGFMVAAGARWRIALLRPSAAPIRALAHALVDPDVLGDPDADAQEAAFQAMFAETTLRRSALGLVEVVEQARRPKDENLLVVVDQFEEIFRFKDQAPDARTSDEAAAFVKLLLEAARSERAPIYVVLTMRSDFLGDCAQFRDLPETINDSQFLVPRLTRDQHRTAIEGPVAVGGGRITPRLVQRLLNDVGDNPDQLPILQHALMRTWEAGHQNGADEALDLPHYQAIGTMAGALSQHGDEIYHSLPSDRSREVAERMFRRLTDRESDARGIRRPTRFGELCAVCNASHEEVRAVIDAFRRPDRALLMPPAGTPIAEETVIDISHESLMRVWQRLRQWVNEEAESAQTYRRLAEAAELHAAGKVSLWKDPELQLALDWQRAEQPTAAWAARYHPAFEQAMAFLEQSAAERTRQRAEEAARRRRELEQAQALAEEQRQRAEEQSAAAHRQRRLFRISLAMLGVALVAALFALFFLGKAQEKERLADSRRLAGEIITHLDSRLDLALLLGVEALHIENTIEAESALLSALEHSPRLSRYLYGHQGAVLNVGFSPTGDTLASGGLDSMLVLWNMQTGQPLDTLVGHRDAVKSVVFSPDGTRLASASWDSTVILWDVALGEVLATFRGHTDAVKDVAFSPSGDTLASAGWDRTIILWDLRSGAALDTLRGHTSNVSSIDFSPDGTWLASGSFDRTIILWDLATGQPEQTLRGHTSLVFGVAFSPDGTQLASGSDDGTVRVWDSATGREVAQHREHRNAVYNADFSPNGRLLASASWDNTVVLWDVEARAPFDQPLQGHQEYVYDVAFSPQGQLASAGFDNAILLWDVGAERPGGQRIGTPETGHRSVVLSVDFGPRGVRLASGSGDNSIRLWNARGGTVEDTLKAHTSIVNSTAFSPDGTMLASGSLDDTAMLWDAATGTPRDTLRGHRAAVLSVAFSPSGDTLATGSWDNTIMLWDTDTGLPLDTLLGHEDAVWSVDFSPSGGLLASASRDHTVRLWEPAAGRLRETLEAHEEFVYSVDFSPSGDTLASGSGDRKIILWDVAAGAPLDTLAGHKHYVQSVEFSPTGRLLASGSWDRTVRIWEAATGKRRWQLTGHTDVVNSVAFSPSGDTLATASWDHTVRFWTAAAPDPDREDALLSTLEDRSKHACLIANRNLSLDEWERFFPGKAYRCTCSTHPAGYAAPRDAPNCPGSP